MKRIVTHVILGALLWLSAATGVGAWTHGVAPSGAATGHSVIQGTMITTSSAVNILKAFTQSYESGSTPAIWQRNSNGYPSADCTSTCTGVFVLRSQSLQGVLPEEHYLYWPSGFKAKFTTGTSTNCSVVSGTAGSCSGATNATITIDGSGAGVLKFTLPDAQAAFSFNNTFNYSGSTGSMALVASRNKTAYETYVGTGDAREYVSANFLTYLTDLNSSTYRYYGDMTINGNQSLWAYRTPIDHIVWSTANQLYPLGIWSGGANTAGTISYSSVADSSCNATGGSDELYTAAATDDQPSPNPLGILSDATMASRGIVVQGVLPSAIAISGATITWAGGVATVTTAAPHGIATSVVVSANISGMTPSGYNGTQNITVTGASTFTYTKAVDPGGAGSGGTYSILANITATPKLKWGANCFPIYDSATGVSASTNRIGLSLSSAATQAIVTFVWDPLLNSGNGAFLYFPGYASGSTPGGSGGISNELPFEVQIAVVNYLNKNMWITIPYLYTDASITSLATLIKANLRPALKWYPEYNNECWGNTYFCTKYGIAVAASFGFSNDTQSWYALRVREIMGNIVPAVFSGADRSRVVTVLAYAGVQNSTVLANSPYYVTRMRSEQLVVGATGSGPASVGQIFCLYTGGTWSGSCTGGKNYSAQVSAGGDGRSIDVSNVIAPAPYTGATNLFYGADNCSGCSPNAGNVAVWNGIIAAHEAGNTTAANALVDDDLRQGRNMVQTVTASGTTFTTPLAHGFSVGNNVSFQWTGGTAYSNMSPGVQYCVKSANVSGTNTFSVVKTAGGLACNSSGTAFNAGSAGTGTVTVGYMGNATGNGSASSMLASNNNAHLWAQLLASQFNAPNETRPSGMGDVKITQYEGSLEIGVPTKTQCEAAGAVSSNPVVSFTGDLTATNNPFITNISTADIAKLMTLMTAVTGTGYAGGTATIVNVYPDRNSIQLSSNPSTTGTGISFTATGNCSTSLNLAVYNYKKSALFAATQKLYWDQFKGRDPEMPTYNVMVDAEDPSQLVMGGSSANPNSSIVNQNQYGLLNGAFMGISPTFENFTGMQQFNAN